MFKTIFLIALDFQNVRKYFETFIKIYLLKYIYLFYYMIILGKFDLKWK